MKRISALISAVLCLFLSLAAHCSPLPTVCPRYAAGGTLVQAEDLFSRNGVLRVQLSYLNRLDDNGNDVFCFTDANGAQSPTLHVHPGDEVILTLTNNLPLSYGATSAAMAMPPSLAVSAANRTPCDNPVMNATSTNLHFHGTNLSPVCHQDEVIRSLVNAGETFQYDLHFPADEPPGLYWYHPHAHGIAENALLGGASGLIVVEGIQNLIPEVAGMPERLLIVRDQLLPDANTAFPDAPAWDLSLNYTPIAYPQYTPVLIPMRPRQKQLWRMANASADTILDVQLQYDGQVKPMRIVAIDGVATHSQDGVTGGTPIMRDHYLLPPGSRVEFIVTPPATGVKSAQLVTLNVDTGHDGDNDPPRPLAQIQTAAQSPNPSLSIPNIDDAPLAKPRFEKLAQAKPSAQRKLYFSEVLSDPNNSASPTNFYITVDGQTPTLYSPSVPPAIVTTQGTTEDWTIENRSLENHVFHIHQIHFLVLARNKLPVDNEYLDTINVPGWTGAGPYPSVTVRLDFRGNVVGDFVYHCHILGHEDNGMMAVIRVQPPA